MNNLIILPLLLPLFISIILMLIREITWHKWINLAGSVLLFSVCLLILNDVYVNGIQVLRIGNWPAPFAIIIVVDMISALMITVTGFVALNIAIYSISVTDMQHVKFSFYPLINILLMGVCGAFTTGDLFNLYVWFEVMLMASFVLMALGGERQQIEGAVKYLTLNFIASILFLTAIGIIYGKTGTLNLADLSFRLADAPATGLIKIPTALFLVAFGIKAGIFPLYFWLPASYHTPPVTVSALFAGLLTKVGVYALIRIFTLVFYMQKPFIQPILYVLAGLTMLTGVLGAASQFDFRRILSFHIISQIGYMIFGLALFTPLALSAAVFYLFHHIIVKTSLFLISGIVWHVKGSYDLKGLGGLYCKYPLLSILFLIPAFSLGGIPPLSGFFAKFVVIKSGMFGQQYILVITALFVGVLTIYSMTKIWAEVFWSKGSATEPVNPEPKIPMAMIMPVLLMALATLMIGLFAEPFMHVSQTAAEQLMDSSHYVRAVLWRQP